MPHILFHHPICLRQLVIHLMTTSLINTYGSQLSLNHGFDVLIYMLP